MALLCYMPFRYRSLSIHVILLWCYCVTSHFVLALLHSCVTHCFKSVVLLSAILLQCPTMDIQTFDCFQKQATESMLHQNWPQLRSWNTIIYLLSHATYLIWTAMHWAITWQFFIWKRFCDSSCLPMYHCNLFQQHSLDKFHDNYKIPMTALSMQWWDNCTIPIKWQ